MSWSNLTSDLIREVLLNLPIWEIGKICQSHTTVRNICNNDYFWQLKFRKDFPHQNLLLTAKQSYIDLTLAKMLGFSDQPVKFDDCNFYSLLKPPIFPIDVLVVYDDEGHEVFLPSPEFSITPKIKRNGSYSQEKYIIYNKSKGESDIRRSQKQVSKKEAEQFIQDKMKEGYFIIGAWSLDNPSASYIFAKLRSLGLVNFIKYS